MKRSELKEAIKAEITAVLSEAMSPEEMDSKRNQAIRGGAKPGPVAKLATIGLEGKTVKIKGNQQEYKVEKVMANGDILISRDGKNVGTYTPNQLELAEGDLNEGTWSVGTKEQIGNFIKDVEKIKIHYNDIVGDDEVYNGLDSAVFRAEEMMEMVAENKSDIREEDEAPAGDKEVEKAARGKDKVTIDFRNVMKKYNELKEKDKKEAVEYLKSNQDIVKKYKKAKEVNI